MVVGGVLARMFEHAQLLVSFMSRAKSSHLTID